LSCQGLKISDVGYRLRDMGRIPKFSVRISCRLTPLAGQKLEEQLAKLVPDKLGRPPIGKLLSQLIMDAKPQDWAWAKERAELLEKPQWIEADRKRRAVEKGAVERKPRALERALRVEDMGCDDMVWADDEG
jgi:hypothetical protein